MRVLIAYDICHPGRLQKVWKFLKNYGFTVQKSIFECEIDDHELLEIKAFCEKTLKKGRDSVIFYPLCKTCRKNTSYYGKKPKKQQGNCLVV